MAGLVLAVIGSLAVVLPAAAAVKPQVGSSIAWTHRPSRVTVAALTSTPFRTRTLAPPASASSSSFRAQTRAQAAPSD